MKIIKRNSFLFRTGIVATFFLPAIATTAIAASGSQATATIVSCQDAKVILGSAQLRERPSDQGVKLVEVSMEVKDLPPGPHGVHIHETASCTPCGSAGGHFDPGPHGFSNPDGNHPYHLGDLHNIQIGDNGKGKLQLVTTRITLSPGPISILDQDGSAFIIHSNEDTFCPDGIVKGCAGGGRIACGIIKAKN